MNTARAALIRVALFALVFVSWMWVLAQPFSSTIDLAIIVGAVLLVFPVVWLGRLLLDRDPDPEDAAWMTTLMHALVMVLFGAAVIRAITARESWPGWLIPIPPWIGLVLMIITGTAGILSVIILAARGFGAPFGIALSRKLANDWFYAWTRNPMAVATLALLVSLGLYRQSGSFVLWSLLLVTPALLFFIKVFEERELEIRFGEPYRKYRAQTPMLLPRRPKRRLAAPPRVKKAGKSKAASRPAARTRPRRKSR